MMGKKAVAVVVCGILVAGALLLAIRSRVQKPAPQPAAKVPPAKEAAGTQVEDEQEAEPLSVAEKELAKVTDEQMRAPGRVYWDRWKFDGVPEKLSPEDFEKAQAILARYSENFARIESLALYDEMTASLLGDTEFSRSWLAGARLLGESRFREVEITRAPIFFKMTHNMLGKQSQVIVTPAGAIKGAAAETNAELYTPHYLDGEFFFKPGWILEGGDEVQTGVPLESDLPGLEEFLSDAGDKRTTYDVILRRFSGTDRHKHKHSYETRYWFDAETGLCDLQVTRIADPAEGESPFDQAVAFRYERVGEVYYPKHIINMRYDVGAKLENHIKNLTINNVKAQQE